MATQNSRLVSVRVAAMTSDSTMASAELDLGPYVNAGKRQIVGVWAPTYTGLASDTDGTFDNKFQESATTVDSDFSDISGAAFTQATTVGGAAWGYTSPFVTNKRYIRSVIAIGGTAAALTDYTAVLLLPRFDT